MPRKKSDETTAKNLTRPRKTTTTKRRTTRAVTATAIKSETNVPVLRYTEGQVRERAYYIYLERQGGISDPMADWFQAELELNKATIGSRN